MATFFRYGLDKTTGTVNRVRMVHGCVGAAHGYMGTIQLAVPIFKDKTCFLVNNNVQKIY